MPARPRVSFVVPTYNYARFVREAIDSLLAQTYQALEVIVIDDGSRDSTPELLEAYQQDPRVLLVRHDSNAGHIQTYNEGLRMARGEFVGLLSADDLCIRQDAVARQVALFDSDPGVGFVYSSLTFTDEYGRVIESSGPWPVTSVHEGYDEFRLLLLDNHVPASGPLVRATCHQAVGYYDPSLPHAGDWDLWLRLSARYRVGYVAEALYGYRRHGVNMHRMTITPQAADNDQLLVLSRAFDALPAVAPANLRKLRRAALRRVAWRAADLERQWRRRGPAWHRAGQALLRYPEVALSRAFWVTMAKLGILSLVGPAATAKLADVRRRAHRPYEVMRT